MYIYASIYNIYIYISNNKDARTNMESMGKVADILFLAETHNSK